MATLFCDISGVRRMGVYGLDETLKPAYLTGVNTAPTQKDV